MLGIFLLENYSQSINDRLEASTILVLFGLGLGILPGLVQAYVWHRSGVKPFQALIWLLCNTLGMALGLGLSDTILSNTFDFAVTFDQQLIILGVVLVLPYGLITALPLQSLLREALLHQQAAKGYEISTGGLKFSPLTMISKIRSRDSSVGAPL